MTVTLEDIPEWARAVDWPALQPTPIPNDASSAWAIHRDGVRLRVAEGCHFYVAADGRSISAEWTDEIAFADICGYLLGTVIGYALRRLGVLTLHASGVVVDGRVLAFVGESGAGKSTTAMAFASVGAAVLTDDVFAVRDFEGRPHAFPSFDHLRVTREAAVPFIGESAGSLALVGPTWDKYLLHPVAAGFARAEQPAPVAAIFLLDSRDPAASAATIRRVAPVDAFLELLPNIKAAHLSDPIVQARELTLLARLLEAAPVYRLSGVPEIPRLPALVATVRALLGD